MAKTKKITPSVQLNKKIASIITILVVAILGYVIWKSHAGAPPKYNATLNPDKTTAVANSSDTITINIVTWVYICSGYTSEGPHYTTTNENDCANNGWGSVLGTDAGEFASIDLVASGPGILSSSHVTADINGIASVTIKSGAAGTTTVNAYYTSDHSTPRGFTTVSFTAVPVSNPSQSTIPSNSTIKTQPKSSASSTSATPVTQSLSTTTPTIPDKTTSMSSPASQSQTPRTTQSALVKTLAGGFGITILAVAGLGLLFLLLFKLKVFKLPFGKKK